MKLKSYKQSNFLDFVCIIVFFKKEGKLFAIANFTYFIASITFALYLFCEHTYHHCIKYLVSPRVL